jgi:xylulokinase
MGASRTCILAIDCGSTNLKAAVFDISGHRLSEEAVPVRYPVRTQERVELDPEEIWQATLQVIRNACDRAGVPTRELATISLGSQAQTFTVIDGSGRALRPFLSWLDARATAESALLTPRFGAEYHRHCTFASPLPQMQISMALWTKRHHPETMRPGTYLISLPGFLVRRLAGLTIADRNLAAMMGFYSMRERDWWQPALKAVGISRDQMPRLVETGEKVRVAAPCAELEFSPDLQIVLAGNDQTAGAYGNDCGENIGIVTLGTALVVYRHAGAKPGPFHAFGYWGPYPGGGYYELATRNEGCVALDWAREKLMPGQNPPAFDACAQSVDKPLNTVFFFPSKMGTETAWSGGGNTAERARAVLEGIGFSLRQLIFEDLEASKTLASLCMTGGGSKSACWLQIIADILDRPVHRGHGDALIGAARMAGVAEEVRGDSRVEVIHPNPEAVANYERQFQSWRRMLT